MIVIRPMRESDRGFVMKAWKSSYYSIGHIPRALRAGHVDCDPQHYEREMDRLFAVWFPRGIDADVMARPTTRIACDESDPDTDVGFACFSPTDRGTHELHYVYVQQDFRGMGVVPSLLEGLKIDAYTFHTAMFGRHVRPSERGWKYTPRWTIR